MSPATALSTTTVATATETPITEYKAPPLLGGDTFEVLSRELGLGQAELQALRDEKVI